MKRFESAQQPETISVRHLETPELVTDQTTASDFGSAQFSRLIHILTKAN